MGVIWKAKCLVTVEALDSHLSLKGEQIAALTHFILSVPHYFWRYFIKYKEKNDNNALHFQTPAHCPYHARKKGHFKKQNRVSELCFSIICIIHFDRWILVSILSSFVSADYKGPVPSTTQATKKRLSKGRNELSSQDPSIVLQIGSRWGSFGKFSWRKIAPPHSACERQGGSTLGMALRNSNTAHVWWDFWGMNAGPQKSCCGWLQLH